MAESTAERARRHSSATDESRSAQSPESPRTPVDLRQLAVRRGPASRPQRRRLAISSRVWARYVAPLAVISAFAAMIVWTARASLLPSEPVTVMPVMTMRAEVVQSGTPLFQCAGWVEPRPTPISVTALADGVVERLLVVEGQAVEAGEPVAYLIDADARLALESAEAELRLREAEWTRTKARAAAARTRIAHPLHLQNPLSEAESMLAKLNTELAGLPKQLEAAEARERFLRLDLQGKIAAREALSQRLLDQAQSELDVASAAVAELRDRKRRLEEERDLLTSRRDLLAKQLEMKIEDTREAEEAEAAVQAAEASVAQAKAAVGAARLRLERMVVRAPRQGRIWRLLAQPGARVGSAGSDGGKESGVVATMYDPAQLQLRTDVPLDQVRHVQPGQPVRIETEAAADGLTGEVLFKTAFTDMQKNTLDVKVAIHHPPSDLRPDMLARVTYFAPQRAAASDSAEKQVRLVLPKVLIEQAEAGQARVWVADLVESRARSRIVKPGRPISGGEMIEIVEGIGPADRVIVAGRERLADGARIRVTGEDATLGVEAGGSRNAGRGIKRFVAPPNARPQPEQQPVAPRS